MPGKIALVVNTLSAGGAEKTVSRLSFALSETCGVDLILNDTGHMEYPFRGRVISLEMPSDRNRMTAGYQLEALIRRVRLLKRLRRENEYDAVISFSEMTNMANVLSRSSGGKTIISVHNAVKKDAQDARKRWFLPRIIRVCCRKADCVVSCSEEIAAELKKDYGLASEKSRVIYNGLDLDNIRSLQQETCKTAEEIHRTGGLLAVSVGRLSRQKGHRYLIRAGAALIKQGLPLYLAVLGEGELRQTLASLAEEYGIADRVLLPGFVKNPFSWLAEADAAVFPSLYEGFSVAIEEALSCGAPVISTDHETGAREILHPFSDVSKKVTDTVDYAPYGILVPVCSGEMHKEAPLSREEELLAAALENVLTDKDLAARYRLAGGKRAAELDIRTVCRQWLDLIEE